MIALLGSEPETQKIPGTSTAPGLNQFREGPLSEVSRLAPPGDANPPAGSRHPIHNRPCWSMLLVKGWP